MTVDWLVSVSLHACPVLRKLANQYFAVNGKIDTSYYKIYTSIQFCILV